VLIRAGEHSTALVTDELVGSREIVVKSLGPQISGIRGIAAPTILGDGRIVIILDMGSLVRSEWRARPTETVVLDQRDRRTFALVVDDSITVRRVTQRLLERNGMRVMTARTAWTPCRCCKSTCRTSYCSISKCREWTATKSPPTYATIRASRIFRS